LQPKVIEHFPNFIKGWPFKPVGTGDFGGLPGCEKFGGKFES